MLDDIRGVLLREDMYEAIYSGANFFCMDFDAVMDLRVNYGVGPADDEKFVFEFWKLVASKNILVGKGITAPDALHDYLSKGGVVKF